MTTRFKEVVYAKALSRELPSVVFSATEPILLTRWTIKPSAATAGLLPESNLCTTTDSQGLS